ncbi:MAG: hypothetical protein J6C44_02540 [Muribaculaceae bacterium]|nr:hypothetical protein [Muribaculaceae bacterium]
MTDRLKYIIIGLVTLLAVSCSSDDNGHEDEPVSDIKAHVTVTIGSYTGPAADPANDYEKIHSWWMVFVNAEGNVETIVSRDPSLTDAVEQETVTAEIPVGNYKVYAFANITPSELKEHSGLEFTIGTKAPSRLSAPSWSFTTGSWPKNQYLPMTGHANIRVTSQVNQPFAIEVVRMFAKVSLTFANDATEDILVKQVSLNPVPFQGRLALMPDYERLGGEPVDLIEGGVGRDFFNLDNSTTLRAGTNDTFQDYFYCIETTALGNNPPRIIFGVNVSRAGRDEEYIYALASELAYINRNDHVLIPVRFTDYVVDIRALFYPPIGGYPAVEVENRDDEFYATFGTRGHFVLYPQARDARPGGESLGNGMVRATVVSCDDPDGIFEQSPVADPLTGEITGVLGSVTGTARVTVDIDVRVTDLTWRTYRRVIYIIRDNP